MLYTVLFNKQLENSAQGKLTLVKKI